MGQRSQLEPGDDIADRVGTVHDENELEKRASLNACSATELDDPEAHPLHSQFSSVRRSPPPFRVGRIFRVQRPLLESARGAAASVVARAAPRGRIRAWVPCCRTGGLAYAVAMLLSDSVAESSAAVKLSVFGTDVDEEALDVARIGRYPARAALDMDRRWRAHYTRNEGDAVCVSEWLRRECIFSRHELLRDRPMARMDLLVCRGVFDGVPRSRRGELAERLHFALRAGGSLLALDHVDSYPEGLFERVSAGHWVARPASRAPRPTPHDKLAGLVRRRIGLELEAPPVRGGASTLHHEALYQALPIAVSIHDTAGALRSTNPRLVALGGGRLAPAAEQRSEPDALLRRLYQEEIPSWVARVLTTGEPIFDVELSLTEAGLRHYWLCNLGPIRCGTGGLLGVAVVLQDVSALKRAEAALREADRQKDDFLALLGHELRNPMAAIRNATELLGRLEQPTPQLLRLRSIFDRQTAQTAKLIDGLLDVARVARGKFELQRVPLELVELVRQAVGDRSKQFEARDLRLLLPESQLWVEADRVRLIQILDNLISNALKFTRPQGCISIELRCLAARGCLRVEDDGDGIDSELLPHIFERFRQGRSMTSQGLGLGLALVKGLCDLHGFALTAHSHGPGRGACFQIEFALGAAPEGSPPESRVDGRSLDLLLVEDNEDVADTLAELLRAEGHRVHVVESGERGLQLLTERHPDAVLSDIGLPGMDGLTFARRIRHDPTLSKIRLVALTGFGDSATESRIIAAGFDRRLIKPVGLEALRSCLARVAVR